MTDDGGRTARYKIIAGSDGNRYQFFCEVSGALVCTTESIILQTPEKELRFAWESEGKKNLNRCHRCGKWVSDVVYNADTLLSALNARHGRRFRHTALIAERRLLMKIRCVLNVGADSGMEKRIRLMR